MQSDKEASRFRLTFGDLLIGPVTLGHACHFGLGLFVPEMRNVHSPDYSSLFPCGIWYEEGRSLRQWTIIHRVAFEAVRGFAKTSLSMIDDLVHYIAWTGIMDRAVDKPQSNRKSCLRDTEYEG